ncbi:MAG: hypothetical protein ACXVX8_00065 [Blastococcus sp.]
MPSSRATPRLGPYPGPYAFPYAGPDRPFPEVRRPRPVVDAPRPAPLPAVVAGVLGIAGALPLALLVGNAVALGGLWDNTGVQWWLYPLLVAPVAQLWGAIALLRGRSWLVLALSCLPGTVFFIYLVYLLAADGSGHGLGWYSLALGVPLLALLLTLLPPVRRWVTGRRAARAAR